MAEGQEDRNKEDLSDEPSEHRAQKFREEGKVAQSRELTGMLALLMSGITLYIFSNSMAVDMGKYLVDILSTDIASIPDLTDIEFLRVTLMKALRVLGLAVLPVAGAGFIVAVISSYAQIGAVFSGEPLAPDLAKINPISGLKKLFSGNKFYDAIRLIIRGSAVTMITIAIIKPRIILSPRFNLMDPSGMIGEFGEVSKILFISLMLVLILFACADLWLQKWEFGKNLRLTKQEAKEESKEQEGDPLIRARIRAVQREMARRRMMDAVKKADVVITNPTHIAVAIQYDRKNMDAPKVIAKGADFLAQKIKKIAAEAGVPQVENVPLARTLYRSVKVGALVPRALFQAVAEVLAYVYKLKNRAKDYL